MHLMPKPKLERARDEKIWLPRANMYRIDLEIFGMVISNAWLT